KDTSDTTIETQTSAILFIGLYRCRPDWCRNWIISRRPISRIPGSHVMITPATLNPGGCFFIFACFPLIPLLSISRMTFFLILLGVFGMAAPVAGAPTTGKSPRLAGRIEHAEVLPALPPTLKPGQLYGAGALQQRLASQSRRFLIPDWLAGVWERASAQE